jgi:hypothetical protein
MEAACPSRTSGAVSLVEITLATTGWPEVSVPVLSKAMALILPNASTNALPLNRMPFRAALDSAESRVGIIAAASAQGDATTRKIMAR